MKLSIGMIRDALSDFVLREDLSGYDAHLNISRFQFFDGALPLKKDTLYIFTPGLLSRNPIGNLPADEGTSLIIMEDPEEITVPEKTAVIYISPKLGLPRITNLLWNVFEYYDSVERSLKSCIYSHGSLQTLTELATPLFGNELTIRDGEFRYIAHSYKSIRFNSQYPPDSKGYTSAEELLILKRNPLYMEHNPDPLPWYYDNHGQNMWCKDIFIREQFLYRVKLIDVNHSFRPYDRELLGFFAELVKEHYLALPEIHNGETFNSPLTSLLTGEQFSVGHDLENALAELGWNVNDTYLVVCIRQGDNAGVITAQNYYIHYLNETFPYAVTFKYDSGLVILANLTSGKVTEDKFRTDLTIFFRNENFRGGMSTSFDSILRTAFSYKQSHIALNMGLTYSPQVWLYRFKDFRYQYLLEKITEDFSYREYLVPGLQRLLKHDREKQSDLYETLKEYLFCDRNVSQAAQNLHIHRSTMTYRLRKIKEITGEDIDDEYSKALLSFLLVMDNFDRRFGGV